ncbi:hypothetical protein [Ulvibacter antarcticus]|uniref:DUF1574 domain-containing protein n=1 Tax=Ulvibacter antarcticus TaxID=442714 RepID=A0A3L9YHF8_9FLAO|nr:hypothetical protein [Ulvibacter antarcticus]RMA59007.1 hypothetical protein BXY75_2389 [Ulvibacter antarcticus]
MQDQKSSSSIFSFKNGPFGFFKQALVFFVPVLLIFALAELMILQIPFNYTITSDYFKNHHDEIEILALGPSQTNSAINPKYLSNPAISLASTAQHHGLDFNILKQTRDRLPNLKYVILELSYSHLELPHNSDNFWKNAVYLKYYNVNAFGRNTYFKDKLIYLSNPDIYSKKLIDHYFIGIKEPNYNKYGFNESDFEGSFKSLDYNETSISKIHNFRINTTTDIDLFTKNTQFLFEMLDYCKSEKLNVVVCTMPLYKTYLKKRNPDILRRRDSILQIISVKYDNLRLFNKETDTVNFSASDFINQNHLNPKGAEKFSKALNLLINREFNN